MRLNSLASLVFVLVVAGCSALPGPQSRIGSADLLDGHALFGETVSTDEARDVDMLALSPAMNEFLRRNVRETATDDTRMAQLLRAMKSAGYFDVAYDSNLTLTASETFERRTGNCLSYTSLFIALARGVRLDANFQLVDVPPIWDSVDDWVILNNHINSIVRGVGMRTKFAHDFIIDFNIADYRGTFPRRQITDATAQALFHSNRGVEALRSGEMRIAFANFKRALALHPRTPPAWVNLGALYSRLADPERAAAAYERAVAMQPSNKTALTNLARLYDQVGDRDLAEQYRARIRAYEDINPYFHYSLARQAYAAADYPRALGQIKRAIALKKDDDKLYFLQGLIYYRNGDFVAARASLERAQRFSEEPERYAEKLAVLAGHSTHTTQNNTE
ncbi:MAG TPA: tetratricopeptide repeat protein [Pseudomonadales bacterium]